ncbi:MAG: hypothetical protein Q9227_008031 [Pyrenula ochraceoflavens]
MAPSTSQSHGKDISSYFQRSVNPKPSQVTPAKRRSPALEESDCDLNTVKAIANKKGGTRSPLNPKTPNTATRYKDVGSLTPKKTPLGHPKPGTPVHVAFRSPKPKSPFTREESSSLSELSSVPSSLSTVKLDFEEVDTLNEQHPNPLPSSSDLSSVPSSLPTVKFDSDHAQTPKAQPSKPIPKPPASPQLSQLHSSQKVVHKGQVVAVRDSDEEDSDSSLADLDELLGKKKEPATSSSSPPSVDDIEGTYDLSRWVSRPANTGKRKGPIVGKETFSRFRDAEQKYPIGLEKLLNNHFDDQETEANLAKVQKGYDEAERVDAQKKAAKKRDGVDEDVLKSVTEGKDDEGLGHSRLLEAVKRTDALTGERTCSFFTAQPIHGDENYEYTFPRRALRLKSWEACLDDVASRRRAFLSGYTVEYWASKPMPKDLISWLCLAIVAEPRHDLRSLYSRTLSGISPSSIAEHVTSSEIHRIFSLLGSRPVDSSHSLQLNRRINEPYTHNAADWRYIISAIETLKHMIPHLQDESRFTLSLIAFRLPLDSLLMSDYQVSAAVESLISHLLCSSLPKVSATTLLSRLHQILFTTVTEPSLQAQLLKHISPTSHRAAAFRIRLARSFLLNQAFPFDPDSLIDDIDSGPVSLSALTSHLSHARYDVTSHQKSTDSEVRHTEYNYTALTSWARLLDIAIDNGIGLAPPEPVPTTSPDPVLRSATPRDKKADRELNAEVDKLADRIKDIASSIRDTGASHMRRTEAKSALEAVYWRLLIAVRTKPRPKKTVFGREVGETERSKDFLHGWVLKE